MSKRGGKKKSVSQTIVTIVGLFLVVSMVISLIAVVIPSAPVPTPTPFPTWTPRILPTNTPQPSPTLEPTNTLQPSPTLEPTQAPAGPQLPTDTPIVTPTLTLTPTPAAQAPQLPTLTAMPVAFRFAVCGDSRDGPKRYRRVLEAVAAQGAEFLVHTGDLVNEGTEEQWQAFQQLMAGFSLPFYPVPGNHDGLNGELDGYLAYSGAPAAHYSFDRGEVHFTLADSHNGGIGAAELQWLSQDLGATDRPVKMVFLHHPPFDPDGTDHVMAYGNQAFMDLMAEMAVDYVFAGHIHAYARQEQDGVVYLITGGAGAPLYAADHPLALNHFLRVDVQGQAVRVDVVEL